MDKQLNIGDKAPDFELRDDQEQSASLRDQLDKPVIVYFFPKAETPGCTTEACDFRDNIAALKGLGYRVIGISPDTPEALRAFRQNHQLPFTLLSDPDQQVIKGWGAWGEKTVNGKEMTGVLRTTIVLDAEATVVQAQYNVAADGHVADLRAALKDA